MANYGNPDEPLEEKLNRVIIFLADIEQTYRMSRPEGSSTEERARAAKGDLREVAAHLRRGR